MRWKCDNKQSRTEASHDHIVHKKFLEASSEERNFPQELDKKNSHIECRESDLWKDNFKLLEANCPYLFVVSFFFGRNRLNLPSTSGISHADQNQILGHLNPTEERNHLRTWERRDKKKRG